MTLVYLIKSYRSNFIHHAFLNHVNAVEKLNELNCDGDFYFISDYQLED